MIDNFFIWDKKSKINGNSAELVLSSDNTFLDNTVVFFTERGVPKQHALVENLRVKFDSQNVMTDEEVCRKELEERKNERVNQDNNFEHQQKEIDTLKKQNADMLFMMMQGGTI